MSEWAQIEDVEALWLSGEGTRAEPATVQAWLDHAETIVAYEFPDLQDRIDDEGDPFPVGRVKLVVVQMVLRVLRNPDNVRSRQQGVQGYSDGVTYAGDNPGGLWLTAEERALLSANTEPSQGEAFAIDTVCTASAVVHADICALNFGAVYCSCGAVLTQGLPLYEMGGW